MVRTYSTQLPLGTLAPDFTLLDTISNKEVSLHQLKAEIATVILFICNHCPYVQHILHQIVNLANLYQEKGIRFIAINSNDIALYPEDNPEKMKDIANLNHFTFPYLYDETQEIAQKYQAACTPEIYLFNAKLQLVYHGQFDNSTPKNQIPVTGNCLSLALDSLLLGESIDVKQKPSIGCNIKWKKALKS